MEQHVCAVVGVGPGNGAAIARRFAREGSRVALMARSERFGRELASSLGGAARFYQADAAVPASLERAFATARQDLGDVDVLVYNAGSGLWGTVEEIAADAFEAAWRIDALGAFVASRQVIPAMKQKGRGSIVLIGATASRKGGPRSAAFSSAKAAQRGLAESMARQLWPAGIHVSLVVIDGVVDLPRTRERMPGKPDDFFVNPDDVAETVAFTARQPRSAWSFEVEARPFGEKW
jgi:NAD(P)-dependent dehydrogenase (short-subunit alcohol dehydrogenase family)